MLGTMEGSHSDVSSLSTSSSSPLVKYVIRLQDTLGHTGTYRSQRGNWGITSRSKLSDYTARVTKPNISVLLF